MLCYGPFVRQIMQIPKYFVSTRCMVSLLSFPSAHAAAEDSVLSEFKLQVYHCVRRSDDKLNGTKRPLQPLSGSPSCFHLPMCISVFVLISLCCYSGLLSDFLCWKEISATQRRALRKKKGGKKHEKNIKAKI